MNDSLKINIEKLNEYKKPLLIYGSPGCGKTHLALDLLKDTVLLRIDSTASDEIRTLLPSLT